MKIVVAPDSFKDCLSANQVAENIEKGIQKCMPYAEIIKIPISDGGEGLLEALVKPAGGRLISVQAKDPLNRDVNANYGILKDGNTAVIEMATAAGLELLREEERDPLVTSTFGVGQLIKHALNNGCSKIIIGLGGSATNDGGVGMVKALGAQFLDEHGNEIEPGGGALKKLKKIDLSGFDKRIFNCEIIGACDVANPLTGRNGASFVYGGQKGGNLEDLQHLDNCLQHFAEIIKSDLGIEVNSIEGAGAAGGTGAALIAFFKAKLMSGIDLMIDSLKLESHIKNADLLITGEGKIDAQTLNGKTISGIASVAKKYNVPVVVITGKIGDNIDRIYAIGVTTVFSIVNKPMRLHESIKNADILIQTCVENIMRTILTQKGKHFWQ